MLPGFEKASLMFRIRNGSRLGEAEQIVLGNELYFASPAAMNDQHEMRPNIAFPNGGTISPKQARALIDRQMPHLSYTKRRQIAENAIRRNQDKEVQSFNRQFHSKWVTDLLDKSSLCSFFSEDLDAYWAYYGDNYKGYCLAFDQLTIWPSSPSQAEGRIYDDGKPWDMVAMPVKYVPIDAYPTIDMECDWMNPENTFAMIEAAFFTKSDQWKTERELRVARPGIKASLQKFDPHNLRAIVVTSKTPSELVGHLLDLSNSRPLRLPVFRRDKIAGSYLPTYVPLS